VNNALSVASIRMRLKSRIARCACSIAAARTGPGPNSMKSLHKVVPRKRTPPITSSSLSSTCTWVPAHRRFNSAAVPAMLPP
jgi:hypothetical protein